MGYTKITLEMGGTVNLGNYQNVRFGHGLEYVLEPGETLAEARLKVARDLREAVLDEMQTALRVVSAYERDRWTQVVDAPASAAFDDVDTLHNGDEDEDDGLDLGDQVVHGFDDDPDEDGNPDAVDLDEEDFDEDGVPDALVWPDRE